METGGREQRAQISRQLQEEANHEKIIILTAVACGFVLQELRAQEPVAKIAPVEVSKSQRVPEYLLYRHFLGWVHVLDEKALATGARDAYQFATPFAASAGLTNADVDTLRNEATALTDELRFQDAQAYAIINAYRAKAIEAAKQGKPLPPVPMEIHQLQQARTALLVQHFVQMQQQLGPAASSRLHRYLTREFAPHVSEKLLAQPKPDMAAIGQSSSFVSVSQ
jgi:hypothetical protein